MSIEINIFELGNAEKRLEFFKLLKNEKFIDSLELKKHVANKLKEFTVFLKFENPDEILEMSLEEFLNKISKMLCDYVFEYIFTPKDRKSLDDYLHNIGIVRKSRYEYVWYYQINHEKKTFDFIKE